MSQTNGSLALKPIFEVRHRAHRCDICNKPYYRVQRITVWTVTNPGKRIGWLKEDLRLCISCFDKKKAGRIVSIASSQVRVA